MYITGNVDPIWDNTFKEFDYQAVSYYRPLDSMFLKENLDSWISKGYDTDCIAGYRYMITGEPPSWTSHILSVLNGTKYGLCFFKMLHRNLIPLHKDVYTFYKSVHQIEDSSAIWRTIVFLEDQKPGHLFQIEDQVITNWKAGSYVSWQNDAYHMAGNIGTDPRHTLQITYIK